MRDFTTEETMARVWEIENVRKLMAKRSIYVSNEWHEKELDELWVSDPELQKKHPLAGILVFTLAWMQFADTM